MGFHVHLFFVVAFLKFSSFAEAVTLKQKNAEQLLHYVQTLENMGVPRLYSNDCLTTRKQDPGGPESPACRESRERHEKITGMIEERAVAARKQAHDLVTQVLGKELEVDPQNPMAIFSSDMKAITKALERAKATGTCTLVYALYAAAITDTMLLKPDRRLEAPPFNVTEEIRSTPLYTDKQLAPPQGGGTNYLKQAHEMESARAELPFRIFGFANSDWWNKYASHCKDPLFPKKRVADEIYLRLDFMRNGVKAGGKYRAYYRWPVGRATQMCGRFLNAHYVDDIAADDEGRMTAEFSRLVRCSATTDPKAYAELIRDADERFLGNRALFDQPKPIAVSAPQPRSVTATDPSVPH